MSLRVALSLAFNVRQMHGQFSPATPLTRLVEYLAALEPHTYGRTLELATPAPPDALLGELGLLAGDRLVLFTTPPQEKPFSAPLQIGDTTLTLRAGSFSLEANGRRELLLGKPDPTTQRHPDLDLRTLAHPDAAEFISRSALWLRYSGGLWLAERSGQTRVRLDEFELGSTPVPVNSGQVLRFYRHADDPRTSPALATLQVTLTRVEHATTLPLIEAGRQAVRLCSGTERPLQFLRAAERLAVGTLTDSLTRHFQLPATPHTQLYRLSLLPSQTRLASLSPDANTLLYMPQIPPATRAELLLKDAENPSHQYTLNAAREYWLGSRLQPGEVVPSLDIDLFNQLLERGTAPHLLGMRSPFVARVSFNQQTWSISPAERNALPVYVNTARLASTPMPLLAGDLLTIGGTFNRYLLRFVVE